MDKKKYLVMHLNGGLGNQLFQVASGYCLAKSRDKRFAVKNILRSNHSQIDYWENIFRKIPIKNDDFTEVFREPDDKFTICLDDIPSFSDSDSVMWGFFQNENYFIHDRQNILELFEIESYRKEYLDTKYPSYSRGCFIHYRRKDYVHNEEYNIVTDEYFKSCIQEMQAKHPTCVFFVFSDDISYAESLEYLKTVSQVIFVKEDEVNCMYLMSMCFYGGIGTNSSFSWWGGWLNQNPDKTVFYPDKWLGERPGLDIWWKGCEKRNR